MDQAMSRPTMVAILAGTTTAQAVTAMGSGVFPVIAPQLAVELGVDPSFVGYQFSVLYGGAMAASTVVGTAVMRWGACRAMQIAIGVAMLGIACSMLGTLVTIAAASVLIGAGMATVAAGAAHLLFRFSPPQHRNLIFSIKQTGIPLGWGLVALLAPAMTLTFGWRAPLATVLVLGAGVIVALQGARSEWDDDRGDHPVGTVDLFAGVRLFWRNLVLRWLGLSCWCLTFVQSCLTAFAVNMLVGEVDYTLVAAGFMLFLAQAAGVCGRVALGWVADRTGRSMAVLGVSYGVMAGCCLVTAFVEATWHPALLAGLLVVFGTTAYGWNGVLHAQVARLSPQGMVSVAMGGMMVWMFSGVLVGPALFAAAYRQVGSYASVFGLLAVLALMAWVLTRLAARSEHRLLAGSRHQTPENPLP
jgi:MFS family permease